MKIPNFYSSISDFLTNVPRTIQFKEHKHKLKRTVRKQYFDKWLHTERLFNVNSKPMFSSSKLEWLQHPQKTWNQHKLPIIPLKMLEKCRTLLTEWNTAERMKHNKILFMEEKCFYWREKLFPPLYKSGATLRKNDLFRKISILW